MCRRALCRDVRTRLATVEGGGLTDEELEEAADGEGELAEAERVPICGADRLVLT